MFSFSFCINFFYDSVYSAGVGKGSLFTLKLPLSAPRPPTFVQPSIHTEEIIRIEESIARKSENTFKNMKDTSNKIKLDKKKEKEENIKKIEELKSKNKVLNFLVVDDSHLNRKMLCKLLSSEGHTFSQACDGVEAVERMKENMIIEKELLLSNEINEDIEYDDGNDIDSESVYSSVCTHIDPKNNANHLDVKLIECDKKEVLYDAILMDFMMPNMDGPTATKMIRELGYKGLIIGVTGTYIFTNTNLLFRFILQSLFSLSFIFPIFLPFFFSSFLPSILSIFLHPIYIFSFIKGNALPSDVEHFLAHGANKVLIKPLNIDSLRTELAILY